MGRACYAWNEGCSCHQGTPPEKERCPDSEDNLQQFLQHKARERIETNIRWNRRKYTHNGGAAYRLLCPTHYSRRLIPRVRTGNRRAGRQPADRTTVPRRATTTARLGIGRGFAFEEAIKTV